MGKKKKKSKNLKRKLNIPFLIIGVLLLIIGLNNSDKIVSQNELNSIDISLSSDIHIVKGTRGENCYRFWSKSYNAEFVLKRGSIPTESYSKISQLKKDDLITIFIRKQEMSDLNDKLNEITVFSIEKNNQALLKLDSYNLNRKMYNLRISVFMIFGAILFVLNSFSLIRLKQNYIIIGLFILGVLAMRIFEFGIYTKN